jgi:AraC-like DNA-binding protein
VGADETLAGYLSQYAEQVLASLVQGETMRHRVRAAIWSLLGDGSPSLMQVAGVLRMPPRTLQRRLAAEGASFHGEIDAIRKAMAIAVLRDRSLAIEDVAFLLGYSDPSTFFRSFKRWTGTTPRHFRDVAT